MKKWIPVEVGEGIFSHEVSVSFEVGSASYNLLVPKERVTNGMLEVELVADRGEQAIVDLPRDTFTTGSRISIPQALLRPA